MAAGWYRDTIQTARNKKQLNNDPALYARVKNITDRLVAKVGVFRSDAVAWDWEIAVLNENTVNAWCMAGGKMAIYTGIIRRLNLYDAEIAAIMGHEIAHALREHTRERIAQKQAVAALQNIVGALSKLKKEQSLNVEKRIAETADNVFLPFGRAQEKEADWLGVELSARAGYDPFAAVFVWQKMSKISSGSGDEFSSTHPSHERRIDDLKEISKKLDSIYRAAKQA
jgi:predicted Zn-dependent protease